MYFLWQTLSVDTKIFYFMTLTFDLLLKKLNLDRNFWTKSDRALILHISIPCDKTFLLIPIFWPSGLHLDFDLLLEKLELVAAGGISPVRTDPDLVFLGVHYLLSACFYVHLLSSSTLQWYLSGKRYCIHILYEFFTNFVAQEKWFIIKTKRIHMHRYQS